MSSILDLPLGDAPCRPSGIRNLSRRMLLRHGSRLHAAMSTSATACSVAMLDPNGVVVSWHGRTGSSDPRADRIIGHSLAQFYLPGDLASGQPLQDLNAAREGGTSTRSGWRCEPGANAFWATVVIESVLRRSGELRGFSFVTSRTEQQGAQDLTDRVAELPRAQSEAEASEESPGRRTLRGRMAALQLGATRHRRLHHLWRRLHGG